MKYIIWKGISSYEGEELEVYDTFEEAYFHYMNDNQVIGMLEGKFFNLEKKIFED